MAQLAAIELHPSLSLEPGAETADGARLRPRPRPAGRRRRLLPGGAAPARAVRPLRPRVLPQDLGLEGHAGLRPAQHARTTYERDAPRSPKRSPSCSPSRPPTRSSRKWAKRPTAGARSSSTGPRTNARKTTIAVYSLRARERPTVSTPVTWEEVEARRRLRRRLDHLVFEADDVLERIEQHGDLFAPVLELEQELPEL